MITQLLLTIAALAASAYGRTRKKLLDRVAVTAIMGTCAFAALAHANHIALGLNFLYWAAVTSTLMQLFVEVCTMTRLPNGKFKPNP